MSYRCSPNVKAQIGKHNVKVLNEEKQDTPIRCNCLDPSECPLPGKCTVDNVVYRATVTSTEGVEQYVGLTFNKFKDRFRAHEQDMENPDRRTKTTLAGHVWRLKDKGENPTIRWEIVCRAAPYSPITRTCNLCISEKWNIIFKPELASLNRRQELFNHCRHKERLLLIKKERKKRQRGT